MKFRQNKTGLPILGRVYKAAWWGFSGKVRITKIYPYDEYGIKILSSDSASSSYRVGQETAVHCTAFSRGQF